MTTTMRMSDNNIGVIWERETDGIISLKVILFIFDVLNCREYDANDFHSFVHTVAATARQLDRNESNSVGLTMTIQNRKYDRYETYHFEFERG